MSIKGDYLFFEICSRLCTRRLKMNGFRTYGMVWPMLCIVLAFPFLTAAKAQEPIVTTTANTTPMTVLQANAILSKKAPGFSASKEEVNTHWAERMMVAEVMFDGDAADEA